MKKEGVKGESREERERKEGEIMEEWEGMFCGGSVRGKE